MPFWMFIEIDLNHIKCQKGTANEICFDELKIESIHFLRNESHLRISEQEKILHFAEYDFQSQHLEFLF